MGHLNPPMVLGTVATVEAALHAVDAPIGASGAAAAARVIGPRTDGRWDRSEVIATQRCRPHGSGGLRSVRCLPFPAKAAAPWSGHHRPAYPHESNNGFTRASFLSRATAGTAVRQATGQWRLQSDPPPRQAIRTARCKLQFGSFLPASTIQEARPLTLQAVQMTETDPPQDEDPVKWTLLTSLPVDSAEAAREVIGFDLNQ